MLYPNLKTIYQPKSVAEALDLMHKHGPAAKWIAGGTSRSLRARQNLEVLIDLQGLNLAAVVNLEGHVTLGACTTLATIARHQLLTKCWGGVIAEAAAASASTPLRNLITVGGNLVGLATWSDLPVALLATDALVVIEGPTSRRVAITDFFANHPSKLLTYEELVTRIELTNDVTRQGKFIKSARTNFDYALVDVAVTLKLEADKTKDVRIAIGAVEVLPRRLNEVEAVVEGSVVTDALIARVQEKTKAAITPRSDFRASSDYLRELTSVLVGRALKAASGLASDSKEE